MQEQSAPAVAEPPSDQGAAALPFSDTAKSAIVSRTDDSVHSSSHSLLYALAPSAVGATTFWIKVG